MSDDNCIDDEGSQSQLLQRFRDLAALIIDGDESVMAAQRLEKLVIDELPEGAEEDYLLESLALHAPAAGSHYVQPEKLRQVVGAALARLEGRLT